MLKREFFEAVVEANINEEMTNYAKAGIAKMDERNANRKSKPSKTAVANAPIKEAIVEFLGGVEYGIASDIAVANDITTQKASALCVQLVKEGRLQAKEVKIPKKGKVKAYYIA